MFYNPIIVVIALSFSFYTVYRWLIPKPIPGIPYNPKAGRRPLGDAIDLFREVRVTSQFNLWCARQVENLNSPICQVFVNPFSKPWVLLADVQESQDIMVRRKEFDRSSVMKTGMASFGHFQAPLSSDEKWRESRAWTQDIMTPKFLGNFVGPATYALAADLMRLWEIKARLSQGCSFSAQEDLDHFAKDSMIYLMYGNNYPHSAVRNILEHLSGLDPAFLSNENQGGTVEFPKTPIDVYLSASQDGITYIEKTINSLIPELATWYLPLSPKYQRMQRIRDQVVHEQIAKSLRSVGDGVVQTGLDHMINRELALAKKHDRRPRIGAKKFRDDIWGFPIAGYHTTGAAMGWIVKFLTENQDVQSRLRSELHSAYPKALQEHRIPTFEEVNEDKHPYMEAVIEEALRLHPTNVTRSAIVDTELLGHHIPKGTVVFSIANGPGCWKPSLPVDDAKRSSSSKAAPKPNSWDESSDLLTFDPERWLVKDDKGNIRFDGNRGPQLIFGLGPRGCYGKRLAYIEMRVLATLAVWNFDLLPTPPELSSHAATDGISHKAKQCYVKLKKTPL